jgi:hypothetical protein
MGGVGTFSRKNRSLYVAGLARASPMTTIAHIEVWFTLEPHVPNSVAYASTHVLLHPLIP